MRDRAGSYLLEIMPKPGSELGLDSQRSLGSDLGKDLVTKCPFRQCAGKRELELTLKAYCDLEALKKHVVILFMPLLCGIWLLFSKQCFWKQGGNLSVEQCRHSKLVRKQFHSNQGLGCLWQIVGFWLV